MSEWHYQSYEEPMDGRALLRWAVIGLSVAAGLIWLAFSCF